MPESILEGLRAIGLDDRAAWKLVVKVAFDSMPAQRRQVLELLADTDMATTKQRQKRSAYRPIPPAERSKT
jgi:hypothetical protein